MVQLRKCNATLSIYLIFPSTYFPVVVLGHTNQISIFPHTCNYNLMSQKHHNKSTWTVRDLTLCSKNQKKLRNKYIRSTNFAPLWWGEVLSNLWERHTEEHTGKMFALCTILSCESCLSKAERYLVLDSVSLTTQLRFHTQTTKLKHFFLFSLQ